MNCSTGYTGRLTHRRTIVYPHLYVTDGQGYLEQGGFKAVLDTAISSGEIDPVSGRVLGQPEPGQPGRKPSQLTVYVQHKVRRILCQ